MISRKLISINLKGLDKKFVGTRSSKDALLYSKFALMELCGWIELVQDAIVISMKSKLIANVAYSKYIDYEVIQKTYGFKYDTYFRKMVVSVIGLHGFEKIEARCDALKLARLMSNLESLHTMRNRLAHTYLHATTMTIDAPSTTINRINDIYDGLKEFVRVAKKLKYI